jgi:hypothetical protein
MSDTGQAYAGTGTSSDFFGGVAWTNPSYAAGSSLSDFASSTLAASQYSDNLNLSNFGFAVPASATINGVDLTFYCLSTSARGRDNVINLIENGGSFIGNNLAASATWPSGAAWSSVIGSSSNVWGATLTPTLVNSTGFGVVIESLNSSSSGSTICSVYAAKLRVYYTFFDGTYWMKCSQAAAMSFWRD